MTFERVFDVEGNHPLHTEDLHWKVTPTWLMFRNDYIHSSSLRIWSVLYGFVGHPHKFHQKKTINHHQPIQNSHNSNNTNKQTKNQTHIKIKVRICLRRPKKHHISIYFQKSTLVRPKIGPKKHQKLAKPGKMEPKVSLKVPYKFPP